MIVYLPHDHYDPSHLANVIEHMKVLGPPIIKAVEYGKGEFVALEGTHRLRAALELGLMPILDIVECDDATTIGEAAPGSLFSDDNDLSVVDFADIAYSNSISLNFGGDDQ